MVNPPAPGPLVEPGPPLPPELVARYSRHTLLPAVGDLGQRRLRAARVLVVGAGGLGSPVLMYLAAAGVGTIGVVDDDTVDESNLQRQVLHGTADVGTAKVDSAAARIASINPHVQVVRHRTRIDASNALDLMRGYDLVVDGADNFPTRYLVADACEVLGLPEVWGSIFQFDGQVSSFVPGHGPLYRDLFPEAPPPGAVPSCAEAGVLGALCGAVGSVMAMEVVKLVCGVGEPLVGRVLLVDALATAWHEVPVRPRAGRVPVTSLDEHAAAQAACARVGRVDAAALPGWWPQALVVDVREPAEHAAGVVPGAVPVPWSTWAGAVPAALRTAVAAHDGVHVVLHCASGVRSAAAAQLLAGDPTVTTAHGAVPLVHDLAGGHTAWCRAATDAPAADAGPRA